MIRVAAIVALCGGVVLLLPVACFVLGTAYEHIGDTRDRAEFERSKHRIRAEEIDVTDLHVARAHEGLPVQVMGRIRNTSRFTLTGATLEVTGSSCASAPCTVARQATVTARDAYCDTCMLWVPPGDTRALGIRLEKLDQIPLGVTWSCRIVELRGR
jgi:hypothetical protein